MSFQIKQCLAGGYEVEGLYELIPQIYEDKRGYVIESYNSKDFSSLGFNMIFVQENQSFSTKGVLRGLHFQKKHTQGKLLRCASGKILDVVVDLRKDSPTFGRSYTTILDSDIQNQIYIPCGFAHGFYVISDTAICSYKTTDYYFPEDEGGIIWNDPVLDINWPFNWQETPPVLSDKDKNLSLFDPSADYFDKNGQWIQN